MAPFQTNCRIHFVPRAWLSAAPRSLLAGAGPEVGVFAQQFQHGLNVFDLPAPPKHVCMDVALAGVKKSHTVHSVHRITELAPYPANGALGVFHPRVGPHEAERRYCVRNQVVAGNGDGPLGTSLADRSSPAPNGTDHVGYVEDAGDPSRGAGQLVGPPGKLVQFLAFGKLRLQPALQLLHRFVGVGRELDDMRHGLAFFVGVGLDAPQFHMPSW